MSQGSDQASRAGRFGPRYGTRIRRRVADIEQVQFDTHRCPECLTGELDRVSTSIWECRKCEHKFAGGAYQPQTESFGQAQAPEEELEAIAEDLEDELEEEAEPEAPEAEPEEAAEAPEETPEADEEEAEEPEAAEEEPEAADEDDEGDEDDDEPRDIESLFE